MYMKNKICVLTGAGMSAESGLRTFRDADGLWENHDVMEVASIDGWYKNKELVLEFYNQRRSQLKNVKPNLGHLELVKLEKEFDVTIVTQNVDDLHERAGSKHIIHLHGELNKVCSVNDKSRAYDCEGDIRLGDVDEFGHQLRPYIVWFGEEVPMMGEAMQYVQSADMIIVIGTSLQVYPAAGLLGYANNAHSIYYIDPNPNIPYEIVRNRNITTIVAPATKGVPELVSILMGTKKGHEY